MAGITDPRSSYQCPTNVLRDTSLSGAEKQRVLQDWALDEALRCAAANENFIGGPPAQLQAVMLSLQALGQGPEMAR